MTSTPRSALVADGDVQIRTQLCSALEAEGFSCTSAADGQLAIELLERHHFDLLVSDLVLPKRHGHTLICEAQRHAPMTRIVVLTQLSDPRLIRDLLSRGIDDYLHKSSPLELVVTKIDSLFSLERWAAARQAAAADSGEYPEDLSLAGVERQLRVVSDYFADRVEGLFDTDYSPPPIPEGVVKYLAGLHEQATTYTHAGIVDAASTRSDIRLPMQAEVLAVQVDSCYRPIDLPTKLMMRDLSATGVRLLHTRAIAGGDLVLAWQATTIPLYVFRIPLSVTRCRPSGRFYDIGGQFDVSDRAVGHARRVATATN